jgi:hypothetical protein
MYWDSYKQYYGDMEWIWDFSHTMQQFSHPKIIGQKKEWMISNDIIVLLLGIFRRAPHPSCHHQGAPLCPFTSQGAPCPQGPDATIVNQYGLGYRSSSEWGEKKNILDFFFSSPPLQVGHSRVTRPIPTHLFTIVASGPCGPAPLKKFFFFLFVLT